MPGPTEAALGVRPPAQRHRRVGRPGRDRRQPLRRRPGAARARARRPSWATTRGSRCGARSGMFATGVTVITTREARPGARHDRERVHVGLARAAAGADLRRPPHADVRAAARGPHLRRERAVRVAVRALGPLRRPPGRADAEPRFEIVHDTPLVEGALAHFVAKISRSYWGGDHSLFLGAVEYARYRRTASRCCSTAAATSASARPPEHGAPVGCRGMLLAAITAYSVSVFIHVTAVVVGFGATFAEAHHVPGRAEARPEAPAVRAPAADGDQPAARHARRSSS